MPYVLLLISLLIAGFEVRADENQLLSLHLLEYQENHYQVRWGLDRGRAVSSLPSLMMPVTCQTLSGQQPSALTQYRCANTLQGQTLSLNRPNVSTPYTTVIRLTTYRGEQHTHVLSPTENHWQIPAQSSILQHAKGYTWFGITHILAGSDHLLFLLCLLWIAGSAKRIFITITGFTLAHSITLALSVLEFINLPSKAVEAVIALSIVFLAIEIIHPRPNTLTKRYPVSVASTFGLVHGLGFASALYDIGLPQDALYSALLFFNLGVEIGQLFFVGLVLVVMLAVKKVGKSLGNAGHYTVLLKQVVGYSTGVVATYWLVARLW